MKLRCTKCNSIVSDELPDNIRVHAFIECRECVNKELHSDRVVFGTTALSYSRKKLFEFFMKSKFNNIDMTELKNIVEYEFNKSLTSKFTKHGYYYKLQNESEKMIIFDKMEKEKIG